MLKELQLQFGIKFDIQAQGLPVCKIGITILRSFQLQIIHFYICYPVSSKCLTFVSASIDIIGDVPSLDGLYEGKGEIIAEKPGII